MSNFQLPRNHLQNAEEEGHIFYLSYHALILSFLQHQKASSILRACTFPVFPILKWPRSSIELITRSREREWEVRVGMDRKCYGRWL